MLDIFGQHGSLVDDKDRLLGRFTDWLETACFVLAEEILFAGDLKSADKMKSMITSDTLQVERKFGSCRQVTNRMKVIATTNHDHAVAAGVRDRRHVVYDVSNEHVGDNEWFDALYRDLADGGTSEFLWLLQSLKLRDWHPRLTIKTEETIEQQRMSGDSVSQWSQACIIADGIKALERGTYDLQELISFPNLLEAYTGFCKQNGLRAVNTEVFGKACTAMFGPRKRMRALSTDTAKSTKTTTDNPARPWGYQIPTGAEWQLKLDGRLGIGK
jgi:phage/plasmid-associated DNA primase